MRPHARTAPARRPGAAALCRRSHMRGVTIPRAFRCSCIEGSAIMRALLRPAVAAGGRGLPPIRARHATCVAGGDATYVASADPTGPSRRKSYAELDSNAVKPPQHVDHPRIFGDALLLLSSFGRCARYGVRDACEGGSRAHGRRPRIPAPTVKGSARHGRGQWRCACRSPRTPARGAARSRPVACRNRPVPRNAGVRAASAVSGWLERDDGGGVDLHTGARRPTGAADPPVRHRGGCRQDLD